MKPNKKMQFYFNMKKTFYLPKLNDFLPISPSLIIKLKVIMIIITGCGPMNVFPFTLSCHCTREMKLIENCFEDFPKKLPCSGDYTLIYFSYKNLCWKGTQLVANFQHL